MNEPEIIIRLDDGGCVFVPGACLSGEYRLDSIDKGNLQAVEVSVLWHSEGKGDEDLAVHEFWREAGSGEQGASNGATAYSPLLAPNSPLPPPRRFSTTLPQSPLSYDGQIVKIRWCVRVRAIFKRGRDLVAEKSFRLGNVPPAPLPPRDNSLPVTQVKEE
jgi:hypothetical protein